MTRTLVTADLHLTSNPRDAYRHGAIRSLVAKAKAEGVTRTLILGDLTEEKDRHSDWLTNAIADHVKAFAELGDVIIEQGNHDSDSDPDMPFFRFLRHMPQVRWVGKPTSLKLSGLGRVLFLPHTRNPKVAWSKISLKGYAYIFAHGTFKGARLGNNRKADFGVPLTIFPRGAVVISGDVHIPHSIGCVTYVGAPYIIDFGDDYKPRCFIIEDDVVEKVPLPGPQKRLIEFDGSKDELDAVDGINPGDILKIRISVPRKAAARWPEERDRLRAHYEKMGCVVHTITPEIIERVGPRVEGVERDVKSDQQIMREFARHRGINKRTLKVGEEML